MAERAGDIELVRVDLLDSAHESLAVEWTAVQAAAERDEFGDREASWTLAEMRGMAVDQTDERRADVAALVDGIVVGALALRIPMQDNTHRVDGSIHVHPGARRRGVGTALIGEAERLARAEGRSVVGIESQERLGGNAAVIAFAARLGYAAANLEVRSDLDLGAELTERLDRLDAEIASYLEGYAIETVVGRLPESWLADQAELERQLNADIPHGDVDVEPEVWDAARVERQVDGDLATGRSRYEAVARHVDSGRLVGFTVVQGPGPGSADPTSPAFQWATLVSPEHRGRRLGLAIKAANLRLLLAQDSPPRRVCTWNAESNDAMLRVNRALGFVPVGRLTEWQKTLA